MAERSILTPEILRQLLRYAPETGLLTWKERNASEYGTKVIGWNVRWANKPAFTYVNKAGYAVGAVLHQDITAHRAAYAIYHGTFPTGTVDHINGNCSDNRIVNLRNVTNALNSRNRRIGAKNTSGTPGVSWDARRKRWFVSIGTDAGRVALGRYELLADAVAVRKAAEAKHGYHANHGRAE